MWPSFLPDALMDIGHVNFKYVSFVFTFSCTAPKWPEYINASLKYLQPNRLGTTALTFVSEVDEDRLDFLLSLLVLPLALQRLPLPQPQGGEQVDAPAGQ